MAELGEPKIPQVYFHIDKMKAYVDAVGDIEAGKTMRAIMLAADAGNYAEVLKFPFVALTRPEFEDEPGDEVDGTKEGKD